MNFPDQPITYLVTMHLRQILTIWTVSMPCGHTGHWHNSQRLKPRLTLHQ
jgi:hypothetical protein